MTSLSDASTFRFITKDPVIAYFSCLSALIDNFRKQLNVLYTFTENEVTVQ